MVLSCDVSDIGFMALSHMQSLQEFIFKEDGNSPEGNIGRFYDLMVLYIKLLPHLHNVGSYRAKLTSLDCQRLRTDRWMGFDFICITCPFTLQLHQLILNCFSTLYYGDVQLPELRQLALYSDLGNISPKIFMEMPKLNELRCFSYTDEDTLMAVLEHVGRQLRILQFSIHNQLHLDRVLDMCPHLLELDVTVGLLKSTSDLQPDTLRSLHTLRVKCEDGYARGVLLQLLQNAPELHTLHLTDAMFYSEVDKLAQMAKESNLLSNLEECNIHFHTGIIRKNDIFLKLALTGLAMNCPRLHTMENF